ncbi:MAG: septal ring lytic transglycosylase RlpA family protein [Candidatus Obscuribacter sp.]|nr:septal ring lytic transglycosylase RlpA family protein [Candidatus Obscuribacter sp.]
MADYYHHSMYGNKTASGKVLHKHLKTAAHRTLPFGTKVRVTNKSNGKSCVVVVNDRKLLTPSKIIDLSHAAAVELGMLRWYLQSYLRSPRLGVLMMKKGHAITQQPRHPYIAPAFVQSCAKTWREATLQLAP